MIMRNLERMSGKLTDLAKLAAVRRRWTPDRLKMVWVNGCWDLLHVGHLAFLREAASYGGVLVVGVNSDASVRQLKGESRPVIPAADRVELLCALEYVDYVVVYEQLTPVGPIRQLRPDIVVKGAQYRPGGPSACPEAAVVAEYGGRVEYIHASRGVSTSDIIRRVRAGESGAAR